MVIRPDNLLLQNVRAHRRQQVSRCRLSRRELRPRTYKTRWSGCGDLHVERTRSEVRLSESNAPSLLAHRRRTRARVRQGDGGILLQSSGSGLPPGSTQACGTWCRSGTRAKLLDAAPSRIRLTRHPARLGNDRRSEVLDQGPRVCRCLLQTPATTSRRPAAGWVFAPKLGIVRPKRSNVPRRDFRVDDGVAARSAVSLLDAYERSSG